MEWLVHLSDRCGDFWGLIREWLIEGKTPATKTPHAHGLFVIFCWCLLALQTERDAFKAKGQELEEELEASKGREKAVSATLEETQGRLEVSLSYGNDCRRCCAWFLSLLRVFCLVLCTTRRPFRE